MCETNEIVLTPVERIGSAVHPFAMRKKTQRAEL